MKLSVGAKVTKKDTHTIDITLVPPKEQATRQVRGGDVEDVLVNAIATIRDVMTKAAEGDDPWVLSAGTIDISFAITQTGTISLGVNGELANELTHTLAPRTGIGPYVRARCAISPSHHPGETEPTGCTGQPGDAATSTAPAKPTDAGTPMPETTP